MDNSWVKLYRKISDNEVMFDDKALRILIFLLTEVDKKTGTLTIGRFQAAIRLRLNSNTFYKALKRLEEKYKIVTLNSNNKYTTVSLSNWAKYQAVDKLVTLNSNNKVTTREQQSNTITRIKNKEYKNNDKSLGKPFGNEDINQLIEYLKRKLGLSILDDSEQTNRRYCWLCIKKFGIERTRLAIDATARNKFWHTKITSFKGIYYNAVKIVSSGRGEVRSVEAKKILDNKNAGRERISIDAGRIHDSERSITSGS